QSARGGLIVHFDGTTFTQFGRQDGYTALSCFEIQGGPDGAIWFGTTEGLFRYEPEALCHYGIADGLPTGSVGSLLAATNSQLWISEKNGLVGFDGRRFTAVSNSPPARSRWARGHSLAQGPDGLLWMASTGGVARFDGTTFQPALTNFAGLDVNVSS